MAGEDLNLILAFVPEEDRAEVADAYEKSSDSYDYEGTVMALKEQVKEDDSRLEELSDQMGLPMVMAMAAEESGINMNGAEGMTAVSYTHLDVYKRQVIDWGVCSCAKDGSKFCVCRNGIGRRRADDPGKGSGRFQPF